MSGPLNGLLCFLQKTKQKAQRRQEYTFITHLLSSRLAFLRSLSLLTLRPFSAHATHFQVILLLSLSLSPKLSACQCVCVYVCMCTRLLTSCPITDQQLSRVTRVDQRVLFLLFPYTHRNGSVRSECVSHTTRKHYFTASKCVGDSLALSLSAVRTAHLPAQHLTLCTHW